MLCLKIFSITCEVQNCSLPLMEMVNIGFHRKFVICNNVYKKEGVKVVNCNRQYKRYIL